MDKQIENCPFCGFDGKIWESDNDHAHCSNKKCEMHYRILPLKFWNTRTTPTPPAGQVEAVARAICSVGWPSVPSGLIWETLGEGKKDDLRKQAKAAIQASGAEHIAGLVAKNDELRDALLDMVWQFCSRNEKLAHSFMSAEEHAFDVLDLDNGMTYEEAESASKAAALPPELRGK